MSQAFAQFLYGFLLLILFGWYLFSDNERAKRIVGSVLSALLISFCIWLVVPPFDVKDANGKVIQQGKISLGLDLQGGASFLLQLKQEPGSTKEITKDMVEQAMEAIRKRVDRFGVSEPIITPQGKDRILVQIPGLETEEQIADARETLRKVAKLEFRLVHPQSFQILNGQGTPPPDFIALPMKREGDDKAPERTLLVQNPPNLTGDKVTEAGARFGQKGWEVILGFSSAGGKQFADLTTAHVNQQFAI